MKGLAIAAALLLASPAVAKGPAAKVPPVGLEKLRQAFAAAVAANDRVAVAKLSHFPLEVYVYGFGPTLSRRAFLRDDTYLQAWFWGGAPDIVKCLKTEPLEYEADRKEPGGGSWDVFCTGNKYYFGTRGGQWAFVGYENINE